MVVHQDHRRGAEIQRALDDLARIDGRVVDGARALHLVGDEDVLAVEEQHAELLTRRARHRRCAVIEQRLPRAERGLAEQLRFGKPERRRLDDLELRDRVLAKPGDLQQPRARRRDDFREIAEACDAAPSRAASHRGAGSRRRAPAPAIRNPASPPAPPITKAFAQTFAVARMARLGRSRGNERYRGIGDAIGLQTNGTGSGHVWASGSKEDEKASNRPKYTLTGNLPKAIRMRVRACFVRRAFATTPSSRCGGSGSARGAAAH